MANVIERAHSTPAPSPVVYYNGTILTMDGDTPDYVEAVAVGDGRIVYAGTRAVAGEPAATITHLGLLRSTIPASSPTTQSVDGP